MRDQDVFTHLGATKNELMYYIGNIAKTVQALEARQAILIKALDTAKVLSPELFRRAAVQMRWDARKKERASRPVPSIN